jgi:type I restriction enzyme S subunit
MRPYLRAANVKWSGLDLSDVKAMQFSSSEADIYELRLGDVVIAEASGSQNEVGKAAIWRGEIPGCCFQNTLLRVRPGEKAMPDYLLLVFELAALSGAFGQAAAGVGIHHLGAQRMNGWPVPLPPLDEQRQIIERSESYTSVLEHVIKTTNAGIQRARQLRRGILELAFSGRLVSQLRGQGSVSSASTVLDAVRATRERTKRRGGLRPTSKSGGSV